MNILFWITASVKQAIVRGFAEAVDELGLQNDEQPDALAILQARISPPAAITDVSGEPKPTRRAK